MSDQGERVERERRDAAAESELGTRIALERKTAELQAILRALPDLFFRFDGEGRFLDFSAPSRSALYAPPEHFLGKSASDVLPPQLAEAMERTRLQAHATGELATLEYELPLDDGLQQFEARYVPFLDAQTIAIVRNITERRKAEAELRESEARLHEAQKLDAVGRLAGGVAHDFNNLLMIISGHAFALARSLPSLAPDHPALRSLTEIRETCMRATGLTRQLLALTKRRPTVRDVLDLRVVLQDMHSMLSRVLGENIKLTTEIAAELSPVLADRAQIEQIVLNLVLNARDAMARGGELSVRAHDVFEPLIGEPRDGIPTASRRVAVSVTDSGCGMNSHTLSHMFEPFFTTKAHGTGLGLFTVQRIVQESGARIGVSSQVGLGTTVVVELPAAELPSDPPPPPGPVQTSQAPLVGGTGTVLVVEDEDAVRSLVVALLRELGYTVITAANGGEALTAVRDLPAVDLILTDVVMPGMSGWELAVKLRERFPACAVLYMSGHPVTAEGDVASPIPQGSLLQKPFTPEALALRIRGLLDV
ncbi:MAG: ATP-binding protein [Polyangiales bacterium]